MARARLLIAVMTISVAAQSYVAGTHPGLGSLDAIATTSPAISGDTAEPAPNAELNHARPAKIEGIEQRYIRLRADALTAPVRKAPRLAEGSTYAGPANPANPHDLAICNPAVRRALDSAWSSSVLASLRPPVSVNDKIEYGFAIDADPVSPLLATGSMETSDLTGNRPNELTIPVSTRTIATVHTHNVGARPTPSAVDAAGELPTFVKSQFHLYVTIPGTGTYAEVDLRKVCAAGR